MGTTQTVEIKAKDLQAGMLYNATKALGYLQKLWKETEGTEGISPEEFSEFMALCEYELLEVESVEKETHIKDGSGVIVIYSADSVDLALPEDFAVEVVM